MEAAYVFHCLKPRQRFLDLILNSFREHIRVLKSTFLPVNTGKFITYQLGNFALTVEKNLEKTYTDLSGKLIPADMIFLI